MKFLIPAVMLALVAAVGCQDKKQADPTARNGSVDLSAPSPQVASVQPANPAYATATPAYASGYAPADASAPVQPAMQSYTPAPAPSAPTGVNGGTYTVKKGDTLWKIATAHYGDGKQYKKIVDANPGLDPSHLRTGQTINLP